MLIISIPVLSFFSMFHTKYCSFGLMFVIPFANDDLKLYPMPYSRIKKGTANTNIAVM